jgi:hypothetical protein
VTITTVRPADQACTEALVPFEEVISLDVRGLDAGTYAVDVNGVRDTFELAMDNRLPDEGQAPEAPGTTDGAMVDRVSVEVDQRNPDLLLVTIRGNLRDSCTQLLDAVPTIRSGEIEIELVTQRPPGQACTQALVPFEETVQVSVVGLEAGRYEAIVQDVRVAFELGRETGLGATIPGCAEAAADQTLFLNRRAGYCFLYPAGFEVTVTEGGHLVVSPPRTGSVEVPQASLTIEQRASEQTLDDALDALEAEYPGLAIEPAEATIGGEQAAVIDTLPGIAGNRQAYFRHGEALYHLIAVPIDAAYPEESEATEQLWSTVVESWAFTDGGE